MPEEYQTGTVKVYPWSWHRIFLLFALTVIMILGFVVVGGGSAMLSAYSKTEARRSVYLSDIVTKCHTKRELLYQLMTAWQCDIPAGRLPPALADVSGDLPRSCDSDLLTQLRHGGQGTLAAGVLLVVASAGGYGGAISGRSGPLALYIVVTVVTAVLELAAVGLLVYNKSQLDHIPLQLDRLLAQPLLEETTVIVLAAGDILTAPGELPTPPSRLLPEGRQAGGTGAAAGAGAAAAGETDVAENSSVPVANVAESQPDETPTTSAAVAVATGEGAEKTTKVPASGSDTSSESTGLPSSSPPFIASGSSADAAAEAVEGREIAANASNRIEVKKHLASAAPSPAPSTSSTPSSTVTEPPAPDPVISDRTGTVGAARSRRQAAEEWDDHTEEVIGHWSPPATDCLLHSAQRNRSHCFSQLEDSLQRELDQTELVLELMLAPLVCAFLACLLQLTTVCSAWNMISDLQHRQPRPTPASADQNTYL